MWGVPLDHPSITGLTIHQLLMYQALILQDRNRDIEKHRGYIEYAMAFMKPQAVAKIQEYRKSLEETSDIFSQQVEQMFGKPLEEKKTNG